MKVKFLIDRHANTVFAYFPDEPFDQNGNKMSYAHVGQHSACSPKYAKRCDEANIVERKDLLAELISIGYADLKIINKII